MFSHNVAKGQKRRITHLLSLPTVHHENASARTKYPTLMIAFITGPPNGQYCVCSLASVVCRPLSSFVTLPAGGRAGGRARGRLGAWAAGRVGGQHFKAGQYGYVPLGRHLVIYRSHLVVILYVTTCLCSNFSRGSKNLRSAVGSP